MANIFDKAGFMAGESEQAFFEKAEQELRTLVEQARSFPGLTEDAVYALAVLAVRIGVMDDAQLTDIETRMMRHAFDAVAPEWTESALVDVYGNLSEAFFKFKLLQVLGASALVMTAANVALTFAYADGEFDDDATEDLYNLVAMGGNIFMGTPEEFLNGN